MNILKKHPGYVIFIVSLLLLLALQFASINPIAQDRFFYFSLDMIQRGPRFFPHVHDAPYPDYIAFVMIMGDTLARLFGHVSVLSVGLPYCIAGAGIITCTYLLGNLHDKKLGLMSAYFCLLSFKFLDGISALDLDLFPALSTALCIYLAHRNMLTEKKPPFFAFFLLWLMGFFCRGPIGLLIPAMITGLYYFTSRHWKISAQIAISSLVLFIMTTILLLIMAYQTGGPSFMQEVMEQQGFGRVMNEHAARYYFFFSIGLLDYAFTSLFAIMVATQYITALFKTTFTQPSEKLLIFSIQWAVIIILFFTLPATKKARYIMPIVPAIALLSAYPWVKKELHFVKNRIIFMLKNMPIISITLAIACFFLPQIETAPICLLLISTSTLMTLYLMKNSRFYTICIYIIALVQTVALHLTIIQPATLHSLTRTSMVPWI